MIVVSVYLPSDALSLCLLSYWGFSYLGRGCSSKVQLILLTLDMGFLLMAAAPDFGRGIFSQPPLLTLDAGYLLSSAHYSSVVQPQLADPTLVLVPI